MEQKLKPYSRIDKWAENVFLFFLSLYLLYLAADKVLFELNVPSGVLPKLTILLAITACIHLGVKYLAVPDKKRSLLRTILLSLPVALIWLMAYRSVKYRFLLFLAVLTVGCIGIDYRKIMRLQVGIAGCTILTAVICSFGGAVPNLVYLDPDRVRSAWGVCYPTDFASFLLFLCVNAWVAWKEKSDLFFLLPGIGALLISHFIANSNTGTFCCLLFLIFVLLHWLFEKGYLSGLRKAVDCLCCAVFPLFGIGMIALMFLYRRGNALAARIDVWGHARLSLASQAYDLHGLKLFGTRFSQIGAGRSIIANPEYNFVDCTYLLILLRYGIAILLLVTVLWVLMTRSAVRMNDRRLSMSMALIALHCVSEHHFTEIHFNILIALPFAVFYAQTLSAEKSAMPLSSGQNSISIRGKLITGALLVLAGTFFGPTLLMWFRTLCSLLEMESGVYHQRLLFAAVFMSIWLMLLLIHITSRVISDALQRRKPGRADMFILIAGLSAIVVSAAGIPFFFRHEWEDRRETILKDQEAISLIQGARARLYVDDVPALYQLEYGDIQSGIYLGEDLVRLQNIALIADLHWESNVLVNHGFLYTPISDSHAVYTNSASAIAALTDAGYHMTGYYPQIETVDLSYLRQRNKLTETEDGGLYLDWNNAVRRGPGIALFMGIYTVEMDFRLPHDVESPKEGEDPVLATTRITAHNGATTFQEQQIHRSQFDENGNFRQLFYFWMPAAEGVEFRIQPEEGKALVLEGIYYQKTPEYDTHMVYDGQGRLLHVSYYDLEGNPYYGSWNYQAADYDYDEAHNVVRESYFDEAGAKVLRGSGYAEVRRVFNDRHQVLREEYFGVDGDLILLPEGYCVVEYAYDNAGNRISESYYGLPDQALELAS